MEFGKRCGQLGKANALRRSLLPHPLAVHLIQEEVFELEEKDRTAPSPLERQTAEVPKHVGRFEAPGQRCSSMRQALQADMWSKFAGIHAVERTHTKRN